MNNLEQLLIEANRQKYQQAKNPLKSHGPDHHWRVYKNAIKIAEKLNVKYDPEILAGAALLHDMAAYDPDRTGDSYHEFDHKIAEEILKQIDFPSSKIPKALYAIANHGTGSQYKKHDEPIEATLLRDADKIDALGPIGTARIIMACSLRGYSLEKIVDKFHTNQHLKHKWDSITTPEAREIAEKDYEYSVEFFQNLANKLNIS